jgi:hypothetical protein
VQHRYVFSMPGTAPMKAYRMSEDRPGDGKGDTAIRRRLEVLS